MTFDAWGSPLAASGAGDPTLVLPTLANAGFESPSLGSGNFNYYTPSDTGLGWTFDGNAGISGNGSDFTLENTDAPEGDQVGILQITGTISQPITVAFAGRLQVSFMAVQRIESGVSQNQTIQVSVGDTVVGTFTPSGIYYQSFTTEPVVLDAGTYALTFAGQNSTGDNTAFIDAVTLDFALLAARTLVNGGFEIPALGTGLPNYVYGPINPGVGWTFSPEVGNSGAGVTSNSSGFALGNAVAPEGGQSAFLQGTGTMSQTITVPTGLAGTVRVSFQAAQRGTGSAPGSPTPNEQTFIVSIGGTQVGEFTPAGITYASAATSPLLLTAGTYELLFEGLNLAGGDNTAFIDDVTVSFTPVSHFDAVADFTVGTPGRSDNGAWQYGWLPAPADLSDPAAAAAFTLEDVVTLTYGGFTGFVGHLNDAGQPGWLSNQTASTIVISTASIPVVSLVSGPGASGQLGTLRFVAPVAGLYDVSGQFLGLDTHQTTVDVHVLQVSQSGSVTASLFYGYVSGYYGGDADAPSGTAPVVPFTLPGLRLAAGDSLFFAIGDGGNGYLFDTTGLEVSVSVSAFGSIGPSGLADDPFGYLGGLGYWQDPALSDSAGAGLSYVRQRWLENGTGQWLSVDSVATEPRYGYAYNAPTTVTDPDGTDGFLGFNSFQEAVDTLRYLPSAAKDEADSLRNQLQAYLVMNIGSLIGFCADADSIAHRWLKTYGRIKNSLPPPMQAVMPPSTSLTEVAEWMEAFATNYLIGFGSEALQTAQQMVLAAIPGYSEYQFLVGSFEQARQIIALVTEIVKDASFFHSLGVSFDVFLLRHIGGPLLDALIAIMKTKAIPPEVLGSIAGAIAFQICLILLLELASEGLATPLIAAEEATEGAAILSRLAESTGRIGKVAQRTQKLVADYEDVIDSANSLKNRVDLVKKAKQWLSKFTQDRRAAHKPTPDLNRRHALLQAKIKRIVNSTGIKQIRKFTSVDQVVAALRGTTQAAERIASAIQARTIRLNFLSNADFEALYYQIKKEPADTVIAFHSRGEIVVRQGALDIDAAVVHEGVHALDYKEFMAQRGAKSITHGRAERRAYLAEQEYRIATENIYQDKLEFESIDEISKHIKAEYPVRLPAFSRY